MKLSGWIFLLSVGLIAAGCSQQDEITRYTVPKPAKKAAPPAVVAPSPQPARMLGAIVPQAGQTWFFKLTGPPADVAEHRSEFDDLLASLTFEGDMPNWKLPDGWQQLPGDGFRFATLKVGSAPGIDLSVSSLPFAAGEKFDEYALNNINRWRGQLGLDPATEQQFAASGEDDRLVERRQIAGVESLVIDFEGVMSGGGMGRPQAGSAPQPPPPERQPSASPVSFTKPDSWSLGKAEGMRKAAFVVQEGQQSAEITVINLPAAANDLPSNINRWRGQVGLPSLTEAELAPTVQTVPLGDGDGSFVELAAPAGAAKQQTILAVVAVRGDKAWFVKLQGDSAVAAQEKERFLEFVKSLKFQL